MWPKPRGARQRSVCFWRSRLILARIWKTTLSSSWITFSIDYLSLSPSFLFPLSYFLRYLAFLISHLEPWMSEILSFVLYFPRFVVVCRSFSEWHTGVHNCLLPPQKQMRPRQILFVQITQQTLSLSLQPVSILRQTECVTAQKKWKPARWSSQHCYLQKLFAEKGSFIGRSKQKSAYTRQCKEETEKIKIFK